MNIVKIELNRDQTIATLAQSETLTNLTRGVETRQAIFPVVADLGTTKLMFHIILTLKDNE